MADLLEKAKAARKTPPQDRDRDGTPYDWGYTVDDLKEMDRLLRELAKLEGWSDEELADLTDQLGRMAPANVPAALAAIRKAHADSLAPWPTPPAKRSKIVLCRLKPGRVLIALDGGRAEETPDRGSRTGKTPATEPEAA